MEPIDFKERNRLIAEDQNEYATLPSYIDEDGVVMTFWKFTWKERFQILFGMKLGLWLHTFHQPLQPIQMELRKVKEVNGKKNL